MITCTSITLHDNPASAAKSASGATNVLEAIAGDGARVHKKLGQVHELVFELATASAFGQAVYTSDYFSKLDTIKVTFSDASIEMWRVEQRVKGHAESGVTVKCFPYWTMLDRRRLRVHREPTGIIDTTLTLLRKTAEEVLTEILSYNAPPYFAVGNVAASLASGLVDIEANDSTHLNLLHQLCQKLAEHNDGFSAEFETRWVGSTCYIDIVPFVGASAAEAAASYTPDPSQRIIAGPRGDEVANRLLNSETSDAGSAWNRIIPLAGPKQTPVTIGQAEWLVSNASYSNPSTTIQLAERPLQGVLDIDADGTIYFGSDEEDANGDAIGFFPITSASTGTPNSLVLTGDATALDGIRGRFAIDADGTELVYLDNEDASGDDVFEISAHYDEIIPYDNLLEDAGVSTDFSSWSGGLPDGVTEIGSPTITEVSAAAAPGYCRHGDSCCRVQCNKDEGVYIAKDLLTLEVDDVDKLFSFTLYAAVAAGRIRVLLVDAEGRGHPQGIDQRELKGSNLRSVMAGGFDTGPGEAYLKVIAMEDSTDVYLDAVNVIRSVGPYPYAAEMGPRALWKAGRIALEQQSLGTDFWNTSFIESQYFEAGADLVEIGSHVTIYDAHDGTSYRTAVTGRVQELKQKYSKDLPSLEKRVSVKQSRPDFSARLVAEGVSGLPGIAPAVASPDDHFLSEFTAITQSDAVAKTALPVAVDEPVRTNTILYSEDISASNWYLANLETPVPSVGPNGKWTAAVIQGDNTTAPHYCAGKSAAGAHDGETRRYIASVYVKKGTADWVMIGEGGGASWYRVWFNLDTLAFDTAQNLEDYGYEADPNDPDSLRVWVEFIDSSASHYQYVFASPTASNGVDASPHDLTVEVFGPQCEEIVDGDELSAYIKTVGAAVTRTPGTTVMSLTVLDDINYGQELNIRIAGGEQIPLFVCESLEEGLIAHDTVVSAATPVYLSGHEGDPAFVTNLEPVPIATEVPLGTYLYPSSQSLLSRIEQNAASITLLQQTQTNLLSLAEIAVIGEAASGSVTSLDNLLVPTRIALRDGWQLYVVSDGENQPVNVSANVDIGSDSIPIITEGISVSPGDVVAMDPKLLATLLRLEPGELEASVTSGKVATTLAQFESPLASGARTTWPLVGTLGVALADDEVLWVEDKRGDTYQVTVDGAHSSSATELVTDSVNVTRAFVDGFLRLPETRSYAGITTLEGQITLKVEYDEIIASINLSSEGIKIDADNIQISGATTFDTGYDPSEKAKVSRQASAPSTPNTGDLWYDTDDATLWRYTGAVWEAVASDDLAWRHASDFTKIDGGDIYTGSVTTAALAFTPVDSDSIVATINASTEGLFIDSDLIYIDAQTVFAAGYSPADILDLTVSTYYQASAPSPVNAGDLWYDTDEYTWYRYNGATWAAAGVDQQIFLQDTEPASGMVVGDVWIDTNNGNAHYTYSGSAWEQTYTVIDGGSITTGTIQSANWSTSAGSRFNLSTGVLEIGGSTATDFSVNAAGVVTAYGGYFYGGVIADSFTVSGSGDLTNAGADYVINEDGIRLAPTLFSGMPTSGAEIVWQYDANTWAGIIGGFWTTVYQLYLESYDSGGTPQVVLEADDGSSQGIFRLSTNYASLTVPIRTPAGNVPSSDSDTGLSGEIAWDGNYLYLCIGTDTWGRIALTTTF